MGIQDLKGKTKTIFKNYGVKKAALFGSVARGEAKNDSDIDLLVELGKSLSLLDYSGLRLDLEDALGRKVDLVQYGKIKSSLKSYILRDEKVFYRS
jgi:uncharacterized protein